MEVYTVGNLNGSYYESLSRERNMTPKSMRDAGRFLELPYQRISKLQAQSVFNPYNTQWGFFDTRWTYNASVGYQVVRVANEVPPSMAEIISKLGQKWRDTDLNIGMYLSPEGRESVEMMGSSLLRIANSARSLKRGDFGGFLRNLNDLPRHARKRSARAFDQGDLSGSFLAAHLGWEPLVKDIYNLSDNVKPVDRYSGNVIKASKPYTPAVYIDQQPSLIKTRKFNGEGRIILKGTLSREPTFTQRFGLDNPFLIAWELVPLSFVADYFLPIGSVIDAMGVVSQIRFSKLTLKDYYYEKHSVDAPAGVWGADGRPRDGYWRLYDYSTYSWLTNRDPINLKIRNSRYSRKPHTLSFADPLKGFKVSLPDSLMRLSTMAALTHQRILSLGAKKRT